MCFLYILCNHWFTFTVLYFSVISPVTSAVSISFYHVRLGKGYTVVGSRDKLKKQSTHPSTKSFAVCGGNINSLKWEVQYMHYSHNPSPYPTPNKNKTMSASPLTFQFRFCNSTVLFMSLLSAGK